jgi:hypothetical protein
MVQVSFRLLGCVGSVPASPLSTLSACCISCWLFWIVFSTLLLSRCMLASSYKSDSESMSSSSVSSGSESSSAFGLDFSHGSGWGARTCFASHSLANCLNSEAAALMRSASVVLVDPLSLDIWSACACVGSPAYACGVSIHPHASSTMFCQFRLVYEALLFPPEISSMSLA